MEFNPKIEYNLLIESTQGQAEVALGREAGWIDAYRHLLDTATRLILSPRVNGLPFVSVFLDNTKRWIYFSRVYGEINSAKRVRLYAIGWQDTVNGKNVRCILWVYPDGSVELAEEPDCKKFFVSQR